MRAQQAPHFGIHGGFPQLTWIHLTQALVALHADAALRFVEYPVDRVTELFHRLLVIAEFDVSAFAQQALQHRSGFFNLRIVTALHEIGINARTALDAMLDFLDLDNELLGFFVVDRFNFNLISFQQSRYFFGAGACLRFVGKVQVNRLL